MYHELNLRRGEGSSASLKKRQYPRYSPGRKSFRPSNEGPRATALEQLRAANGYDTRIH